MRQSLQVPLVTMHFHFLRKRENSEVASWGGSGWRELAFPSVQEESGCVVSMDTHCSIFPLGGDKSD
jgi:hypothetical protein